MSLRCLRACLLPCSVLQEIDRGGGVFKESLHLSYRDLAVGPGQSRSHKLQLHKCFAQLWYTPIRDTSLRTAQQTNTMGLLLNPALFGG